MKIICKKVLMTCLATILSLSLLAGCSPARLGSDAGSQSASSAERTEITLWTSNRADFAIREEKRQLFNNANPDMYVSMEVYTDNFLSTLELAFISGQAPDIFLVADNNIQHFVDRGMAYPLDEFLTPEYIARFGDLFGIETVNMVNGRTYTLAERGLTYRLLYNQDIFDQVGIQGPPRTVEQMFEYARMVTEWGRNQGIFGFAMQLNQPFSAGERIVNQLGFRNNISAYDFTNGVYDFTVMEPILDVFRRMYAEGIMFPGSEGLEMDPLRVQFAAGNIAMYINASWEPSLYAPDGQFPTTINWGAVPLPGLGTENPTGRTEIRNAGRSWAISSSSQNPEKAWRYIEFMLSDEYLAEYQERGFGLVIVPSAVAIAGEPDIFGFDGFLMDENIETIWPVRPDMAGLVVEGRSFFDTYAAIIIGAADMSALLELNERYNSALDRAIANGDMEPMLAPNFSSARP